MKRVLVIALALISCFAVEAQLRIIRPSQTFMVPDISRSTYMSGQYYDDGNPLFVDLYSGEYNWYFRGSVGNIVASSVLSPQGSSNYKVGNLHDFNHETAWVEGVSGYGVGQWIEYQGVGGNSISTIKILNGYVKNDRAWSQNSRVKRLKVYCDGKPICVFELQNSRSLQSFDVSDLDMDHYARKTFRFEILEVYPGTTYQDTVISEIYFE